MPERPPELFDRDVEWADLLAFAGQGDAGTRLALVRGRRRQGKSYLLRRLAATTNGFYYQALEEERAQALEGFGAALGAHLRVPGGRLQFEDWDAAIRAMAELPSRDGPPLVVIDEFPYLLAHSKELPSALPRMIDGSRDGGPAIRLVICGSALSVMANLLSGARARRGRATHDLPIRPFDYRTAARFWGIRNTEVAFRIHSVIGGTPGYRDLLPGKVPSKVADFGRWLADGPLNPASALFREDDYLLTEQPSLTDRSLYHSVVAAIAAGNTTQGAIAAALGREQRAVQHPLKALEDAGFVDRQDDALRSRRPIYRLTDPIVRFHHVVTRRDLARFEDRRTTDAWRDARPRFESHILGPHFEQLAREFTAHFASSATLGGAAAVVAPSVVNDAAARTTHQLDVVALARARDGSTSVLALGEAKHTSRRPGVSDLRRLEHVRDIIAERRPDAREAKLLLFSANGFDQALTAEAERHGVELIDLARLYGGV